MKAIVALIVLGVAALSYAGVATYSAFPGLAGPLALPYAYTPAYNTYAGNYQLTFDTSLPGSAYASYPYAAAPTAYGYGVYKAL